MVHLSNEKRAPGWLGYIGDEILPSYIAIIIYHYANPYKPTSIMESRRVFFVAHLENRLVAIRLAPQGSTKHPHHMPLQPEGTPTFFLLGWCFAKFIFSPGVDE